MKTENQKERVNKKSTQAIKMLMEFCIKEKIINPKITMDAKTTDGEHYRLIFDRLDIDEIINEEPEMSEQNKVLERLRSEGDRKFGNKKFKTT